MDNDPAILDSATQGAIIDRLSEKISACYVFPEVADQLCIYLLGNMLRGEYEGINEANLFALALTMHMQEVTRDEHLWVRWHVETLPDDDGQLRLNPGWQQERQRESRLANYGFARLERLPGNVGYLDIHYFHRPEWGGDTLVSVMNFLSHTNALIVDLRQCTGGFPGMVSLVCSYLFGEEPIHLVSIYWRDEDITQEFWTEPTLPGPRFGEKRVYVLTSQVTFSAGEMCADVLQSRQRATIIGEKTDGGANAGASYRIHPHFEAFIPIGRTINPLTGTNWEGKGVIPDISVSQAQGFNVAYKLALQSVLTDLGEPNSDPLRDLANEIRVTLNTLVNP
jgi:hypothetical protein